jgi:hypothetical protein
MVVDLKKKKKALSQFPLKVHVDGLITPMVRKHFKVSNINNKNEGLLST